MVLDAREGEGVCRLGEGRDDVGAGDEGDRGCLPGRPRDGGWAVHRRFGIREEPRVGPHIVAEAAVIGRDGRHVAGPEIRGHVAARSLVEPLEFTATQGEDAAQYELGHPLGMRLGVGQREGRAPRAAEYLPAFDPEVVAQQLEVGNQVPGGVGAEVGRVVARRRDAAAAISLVEQDDAVRHGVEQAPVVGRATRARPTVQEHHGLAVGVAALFPVDLVAAADLEHAGRVRLERRIEGAHGSTLPVLVRTCEPIAVVRMGAFGSQVRVGRGARCAVRGARCGPTPAEAAATPTAAAGAPRGRCRGR